MKSKFPISFKHVSLNTIILSAFFFLSSLLQLGFFIVLTYFLPQSQVGLYELGRSCLEIGAGIAGPGFIALVIRESSHDIRWWEANHPKLRNLVFCFSGAITSLLIFSFLFLFDSWQEGIVLVVFCISIVFQNTSSLYDALLQSKEHFFVSSVFNILFSIAFVACGLLCLFWMPYALLGIAFALLFRWLAQTIALQYFTRSFLKVSHCSMNDASQSIKSLLTAIFPLLIGTVSFVLYNRVDVLMLQWMGHGDTIAFYGAAFRPIGFLITFFSTFYQALAPTLARLLKMDVKHSFYFMMKCGIGYGLFGLVLALFLYGNQDAIIVVLYPDHFMISVQAFQALLWTLPIAFLGNAFGNFLVYQGRSGTLYYAIISMIGLIINVVGNLIVIPVYNFEGAAWITLATDGITTLFMVCAAAQVARVGGWKISST